VSKVNNNVLTQAVPRHWGVAWMQLFPAAAAAAAALGAECTGSR